VAEVTLLVFREPGGGIPLLEWLAELQAEPRVRCYVRIERLRALGNELRRPEAAYLGSGLYGLRAKWSGINYRMIYSLHGRSAVVLSHGFVKQQSQVPGREIATAKRRRQLFLLNPTKYSIAYEG
jgi:phage-related protein